MATKKPKAAKVSATQSYLLDALAEAEKVAGIQRVVVGLEERISTGLLSLDLILGRGGLAPGMYTFAGGEQSAKTTTQLVAMAASVDQNVSLRILVDAEGSSGSSTDYVQNIVDTVRGVNKPKIEVEDLFGALDNKGNYTKPPIVVYKDDNSLEPVMNFLAALFRRLPDKRFEDGAWWYIFDNDKAGQKLAQRMGVEIDVGRSKLAGKLMAPAPDGSPQAMILVDGWAALLPVDLDEDGGKAGLGLVARKFAENLPKVKGKVRAKRIIIIGTNQLKEKPMVMFGNPIYESGGNALKYFCLRGNSLINTSKGIFKIEELNGGRINYSIQTGRGLEVPNMVGLIKRSCLTQITTEYSGNLAGSPEHRIRTLTKCPKANNAPSIGWTMLKDASFRGTFAEVRYGQNLWSKTNADFSTFDNITPHNSIKTVTIPQIATEELAYLVGLLTADGYIRAGHIQFTNTDKKLINKVKSLLKKLFGIDSKVQTSEAHGTRITSYNLAAYSTEVGGFLRWLGLEHPSYHKEVPHFVRTSTREVVISYLKGYVAGDAGYSQPTVLLSSASEELAYGILQLLLNLGIVASVRRDMNSKNWMRSVHLAIIIISPDCIRDFMKLLAPPGVHSRKEDHPFVPRKIRHLNLGRTWNLRPLLHLMKGIKIDTGHDFPDKSWIAKDMYEAESIIRERIKGLRTRTERDKYTAYLDKTMAYVNYTVQNKVIWSEVVGTIHNLPEENVYDFNTDSHTVVANGVVGHNSDARIWHTARAVSAAPYPVPKTNIEKGNIEVEDSVEFPGQKDAYRYVHLVAKKNKLGVPNRETFMRIWISDGEMKGRGIDPVFDLFHVLMQTNQASGKRSSIKLNIKSLGEATKSISWSEFKILVLGTIEERNAILSKIGYREGIDLRSGLTKMSKNGIIEKLYLEARGGGKAEKIENSDDGDIPEDDDSEDLED